MQCITKRYYTTVNTEYKNTMKISILFFSTIKTCAKQYKSAFKGNDDTAEICLFPDKMSCIDCIVCLRMGRGLFKSKRL